MLKEGKTSMVKKYRPLDPDQLRKTCDPDSLGFESSAELAAGPVRVLAQDRAVKALTFGMGLGGLDFNVYVAGPSKTGLTYITRTLVEEEAKKKGRPRDWCYVYNFQLADQPQALSLPAGKEVIEAVKKRRFHVYAITGIEEGLEILTGKKIGRRKKDDENSPTDHKEDPLSPPLIKGFPLGLIS